MPHRLMEMKMITLQRVEFKDEKMKRLVHLTQIPLQQLKMVLSSLYGLHMLLMRQRMVSWGISSQIWTRASLSSWTV